jgi:hypothetical protein
MGNGASTIERWNGFVAKITERHREILEETAEGVAGLMEEETTDSGPLFGALKAIEIRLIELRQKLENTFSEKIALSLSGGALDAAEQLLRATDMNLEHEFRRLEAKTVGEFYRRMAPLAEQKAAEEVICSKCGGPLELGQVITARTVKCEHCEAINNVVPHAVVGLYYASAPDMLALEACLDQRIAIEQLRHQVDYCGAPDDRQKWEQMERQYWDAYLEERCRITPMGDDERAQFVESRMDMWRRGAF